MIFNEARLLSALFPFSCARFPRFVGSVSYPLKNEAGFS